MRIDQSRWTSADGWSSGSLGVPEGEPFPADLVLAFGDARIVASGKWMEEVARRHPGAEIVGCSTAGEIRGGEVTDDALVTTAIRFEATRVAVRSVEARSGESSFEAGARLASSLDAVGLAHVMVLSEGKGVNGSALVAGMTSRLPASVAITGGLAGDGPRFERTFVAAGGRVGESIIAAIGFYGARLRVGFGSLGGWDPFGPERLVSRANGNVLAELDGQPALALYKKYLGEHASGLPATGLLFPLSVRTPDGRSFVRTILAVDEIAQTLTFAGDVPEGAYARLMKANFDRLVDGAAGAARTSQSSMGGATPELAVLISCVGRKLVLKQRTEEEVDAVRAVIGERVVVTGFYSYGEICPSAPDANCELHNQTMTITTFSER